MIVYRLVTTGGIEEKIYRRQVYKKGMNLQTIETAGTSGNQNANTNDFMKYFDNSDLFELFEFESDPTKHETLDMLLDKDGFSVNSTPTLDRHIAFLNSLKFLAGLSLNSNLYSKSEGDADGDNLPANLDQLSNST